MVCVCVCVPREEFSHLKLATAVVALGAAVGISDPVEVGD